MFVICINKLALKITKKNEMNFLPTQYITLSVFMKKQSRGFRSKKSNIFAPEDVKLFLTNAPNDKYLATKVRFTIYIYILFKKFEFNLHLFAI